MMCLQSLSRRSAISGKYFTSSRTAGGLLSPKPRQCPRHAVACAAVQLQSLPHSILDVHNMPVSSVFEQHPSAVDTVAISADHIAAVQPLFTTAEGLETPIQLIYLTALLGFLAAGAYLVVRQVLIRRELDEAAKALGERIRTGEATCEDYYELGVILTRKKLFTQATKNLEKAKKLWDGEESDLAQVHNALGFCYFSMEKTELAIQEYKRAVELQAGYVTAWNNLGDAYERNKEWRNALTSYQEALAYAPNNKIAMQRMDFCKAKVERLSL